MDKQTFIIIYTLLLFTPFTVAQNGPLFDSGKGVGKIKNKLFELGVSKVDYIEVLDINKLIKPYGKIRKYKIFIAYYLQSTRLIDNI